MHTRVCTPAYTYISRTVSDQRAQLYILPRLLLCICVHVYVCTCACVPSYLTLCFNCHVCILRKSDQCVMTFTPLSSHLLTIKASHNVNDKAQPLQTARLNFALKFKCFGLKQVWSRSLVTMVRSVHHGKQHGTSLLLNDLLGMAL